MSLHLAASRTAGKFARMPSYLPLHISATAVAEAVRTHRVSAVEVAEHAVAQASTLDHDIRSLVWRDDQQTLAQAAAVDAAIADGRPVSPLAGVPMTVKDLFSVAGQPATRSSLAVDDHPADQTDTLVELALAAGLVQLGRSASPELGMTTSCESDRWGTTRNPWDLERSPGGSSGGSAAAVAAGIVPVALAGDGGGSIRVPAAFCGVVGHKPSRGLLPTRVEGWAGGAVDGAITRSVADAVAVLAVLAQPDPYAWSPQARADGLAQALDRPTESVRVGLLVTAPDPSIPVDPACAAAATEVADMLRAAGHDVVEVHPVPEMVEIMDIYPGTVIPAWLALDEVARPELLPPHVRRHLEHARGIDAAGYLREVLRMQAAARTVLHHLFDQVDVLVTPTTATRVPAVGVVRAELFAAGGPVRGCPVYEQTLAFTTVPSVIGSPAVSVPTHVDSDGLSLGVQLVGAPGADALLLRLARDLETQTGWLDRCPRSPAPSTS